MMVTRSFIHRLALFWFLIILAISLQAFGFRFASAETGQGDHPEAVEETALTVEDEPTGINVLSNDAGLDDAPLALVILSGPANGLEIVYQPAREFHGQDRFTYQVCDADGDCDQAEVTVIVESVDEEPVAQDDTASTDVNTEVIIDVMANDSDPDGDPLSLEGFDPLSANAGLIFRVDNGTPSDTTDDKLSYTPFLGFDGTDTFTYTISDGEDTAEATVTVLVGVEPEAPIANDDSYSTAQNSMLSVPAPGVLENDDDPNESGLAAFLDTAPANGILELNEDGSFEYTPNVDFAGEDSFTYLANDGASDSNIAQVTLVVNEVNYAPVAVDDSFTVGQLDILATASPGVLENDGDANGDPLESVLESGPSQGELALDPDGSFEYTPNQDFVGQDSFTYRASDGSLQSNPATVTISILDQVEPEVVWVEPVETEKVYEVGIQKILLAVDASDNVNATRVEFFRWDAVNEQFVDIGTVEEPPFEILIDTNQLNRFWNQVYAVTYDEAGNRSDSEYIWLFRWAQIFIPVGLR